MAREYTKKDNQNYYGRKSWEMFIAFCILAPMCFINSLKSKNDEMKIWSRFWVGIGLLLTSCFGVIVAVIYFLARYLMS